MTVSIRQPATRLGVAVAVAVGLASTLVGCSAVLHRQGDERTGGAPAKPTIDTAMQVDGTPSPDIASVAEQMRSDGGGRACRQLSNLQSSITEPAWQILGDTRRAHIWRETLSILEVAARPGDGARLVDFVRQGYPVGRPASNFAPDGPGDFAYRAIPIAPKAIGLLAARMWEAGDLGAESLHAFLLECMDARIWREQAAAWLPRTAWERNSSSWAEDYADQLSGLCTQALGFTSSPQITARLHARRTALRALGAWPEELNDDVEESARIGAMVRRDGGIQGYLDRRDPTCHAERLPP